MELASDWMICVEELIMESVRNMWCRVRGRGSGGREEREEGEREAGRRGGKSERMEQRDSRRRRVRFDSFSLSLLGPSSEVNTRWKNVMLSSLKYIHL